MRSRLYVMEADLRQVVGLLLDGVTEGSVSPTKFAEIVAASLYAVSYPAGEYSEYEPENGNGKVHEAGNP